MEIARFYLINRVVVKLILFAHVTQSSYYDKPELVLLKKICKLCGKEFETIKYGEKRIYCFECNPQGKSNSITLIRKKAKMIGIEKLGGKCFKCGENKFYLLDFHHRNPEEKEGELSDFSKGYNLDKFFEELQKCDLLCANCHREYHYLHNLNGLSYQDYLSNNY